MSHDTKELYCAPPPPHPSLSAGKLSLKPNFQKWETSQDLNFQMGKTGKEGDNFFQEGGCIFYIKSKLKSEIMNDKNRL